MKDIINLFSKALNIESPWIVQKVDFKEKEGRLDIYVDFTKGATFKCPTCGKGGAKAYDTKEEIWRHLDFFQYETYIIARVPRVECKNGCGVHIITVPWSRPDSGFILFFENLVMTLGKEIPVATVGRIIKETDNWLWRIIKHYVESGRERSDFSNVCRIGVDETAAQRGHKYITSFVDIDQGKLIFATPGKGKETLQAFVKDFIEHGGSPDNIKEISCDLSPAFISGIKEFLPEVSLVFDRFHLVKIVNEGLDEVRRQEVKENIILKKTRYQWLKNPDNLTVSQKTSMEVLSKQRLKTGRAYQIKLAFQDFFNQLDQVSGEAHLKK